MGTPKMLGVRRAGVTGGLHYLERRGHSGLAREQIIISDPDGLKAAANATYHQPEKSGYGLTWRLEELWCWPKLTLPRVRLAHSRSVV